MKKLLLLFAILIASFTHAQSFDFDCRVSIGYNKVYPGSIDAKNIDDFNWYYDTITGKSNTTLNTENPFVVFDNEPTQADIDALSRNHDILKFFVGTDVEVQSSSSKSFASSSKSSDFALGGLSVYMAINKPQYVYKHPTEPNTFYPEIVPKSNAFVEVGGKIFHFRERLESSLKDYSLFFQGRNITDDLYGDSAAEILFSRANFIFAESGDNTALIEETQASLSEPKGVFEVKRGQVFVSKQNGKLLISPIGVAGEGTSGILYDDGEQSDYQFNFNAVGGTPQNTSELIGHAQAWLYDVETEKLIKVESIIEDPNFYLSSDDSVADVEYPEVESRDMLFIVTGRTSEKASEGVCAGQPCEATEGSYWKSVYWRTYPDGPPEGTTEEELLAYVEENKESFGIETPMEVTEARKTGYEELVDLINGGFYQGFINTDDFEGDHLSEGLGLPAGVYELSNEPTSAGHYAFYITSSDGKLYKLNHTINFN